MRQLTTEYLASKSAEIYAYLGGKKSLQNTLASIHRRIDRLTPSQPSLFDRAATGIERFRTRLNQVLYGSPSVAFENDSLTTNWVNTERSWVAKGNTVHACEIGNYLCTKSSETYRNKWELAAVDPVVSAFGARYIDDNFSRPITSVARVLSNHGIKNIYLDNQGVPILATEMQANGEITMFSIGKIEKPYEGRVDIGFQMVRCGGLDHGIREENGNLVNYSSVNLLTETLMEPLISIWSAARRQIRTQRMNLVTSSS
ncbi:MAG: hypothetical protein WCP97_02950 [bacterium]